MKKIISAILLCFMASGAIKAQTFNDYFVDKTLRIDYIFSGDAGKQAIHVDERTCLPGWAGRRHHLSEVPLTGNGQIIVRDSLSGTTVYRTSFSTLFQEWITTDEAKTTDRGFENTFLVPFPKRTVQIEVQLFNSKHQLATSMKHYVRPADILIQKRGNTHVTPHKYLLKSGTTNDCIDVVIMAEGYSQAEMPQFYQDAQYACNSIFSYEPFKSMKNRFNVIAVESVSKDSGVSVPRKGLWKSTACQSHFDTFYSDRYLTTTRVKAVNDLLVGIPYEHIIIIANTNVYGGGGIYNFYTLTAAHHSKFKPVVAHEFGHSFAGLADEYFYDQDLMTDTYPLDVEPWEPNITTRVDFASKWQDMVGKNKVDLYEGGGYSKKGIYRPYDDCRMRTNEYPDFCPVCQRAIKRMIDFYTLP